MRFRLGMIGVAVALFALYLTLILSLFSFYDAEGFLRTIGSPRTLYSIQLSMAAGTAAALLAVAVAIPAAYALSRYSFPGKTFVDTLLELPAIVSPVALGAMLLIFFNTRAGDLIEGYGFRFVFDIPGIVLAQFVTTAGLATRLVKAAIDEIPVRYEAVARSLGASPARAFSTVTLPLAARGILAAGILSWAKAIGEFGATITLAGSVAMKTETLPIAIFTALSSADIVQTVVLIFILLTIGLGILYGVRLITGRV